MPLRTLLCSLLVAFAAAGAASAETAKFDLAGPSLKVTVSHGGRSLPIGRAPNLSPGDVLQVRADLPQQEAVRYLLVLAFLRGAADPPPKTWFYQAKTWGKGGGDQIRAVVPDGAQQALVFLAPATGGDFKTLVNAVRGKPGAFVRAGQALNQAALDRSRLDTFLAAIHRYAPDEPDRLKTVSPLLARSLAIKLNEDCLNKAPAMQAACLTGEQDALVLDDGHAPSMVQTLTTGSSADLALEVTATPKAGFGYYSPYLAAVMDLAHILDSLRTAQFQYIPALPKAQNDTLSLTLNTPPSFHDPKSVLVTGLPPVEPAQPPELAAVDPKAAYCIDQPDLLLPVEGAPLVFSTGYARDVTLRVKTASGAVFDLPARAEAEKGGFVVDTTGVAGLALGPRAEGKLVGGWGFGSFESPRLRLEGSAGRSWSVPQDQQQALVVGREDHATAQGGAPACIKSATLSQSGRDLGPVTWKPTTGGVTMALPLADAKPGPLTLVVQTFGPEAPQTMALTAFAEAGRLDGLDLHAGDDTGVLKGARLDEVSDVVLGEATFKPGELSSAAGKDELTLTSADAPALAKLSPGQALSATVRLRDGRKLDLRVEVQAPRPRVALVSKSIQPPSSSEGIGVTLTDSGALSQNAELSFSLHAEGGTKLTPRATVEVATADGSASTTLQAGSGLTLVDPSLAMASLDVAKALGPSAFGPLKFRVVDTDGASDWQPLATLVRVPELRGVECQAGAPGCTMTGEGLFLIDQISSSPAFSAPVAVPQGYPGQSIAVPAPADGRLYLKLHDQPQVVDDVVLPGRPASGSTAMAETAPVPRQAKPGPGT